MKKAEYCILNKQYSEEEYLKMKDRIIEHMKETGEWGQYFPMKYSPWSYNETVAQDYFPLDESSCVDEGLSWHSEEKLKMGSGDNIPDSIDDVDDSILKMAFVCEKTGRQYRINETELKLYKNLGIPIPHFAPETRNEMRIAMRNPRKVWDRECEKCKQMIESSFSPERNERIYCEQCYLDEIL